MDSYYGDGGRCNRPTGEARLLLHLFLKAAYKSIKKFIDAFLAVAKRHYELGDASCAVPYERKGYMEDREEDGSKPAFQNPKPYVPYKGKLGSSRPNEAFQTRKEPSYVKEKPVYFMEQSDMSDPEPSDHSETELADSEALMHKNPQPVAKMVRDPDSDDEEIDSDHGERSHKTPVIEDYSLAEANIPPDRSSATRALFMVGNDGETRPRGCMYYTIFGNCLKGVKCANADGHTPEARVRTAAWLKSKLDEIPKVGTNGPARILSRESRGSN